MMDLAEDFGFPLFRRLFEAVYVVPQERGVQPRPIGKFGNVYFLVGQKEPLEIRWVGIGVFKALKADILVQLPPLEF